MINIPEGEITTLPNVQWDGKPVYQLQKLIPLLSNNNPVDLGIGSNRDVTTFRFVGDQRINYFLTANPAVANPTTVLQVGIPGGNPDFFQKVTADYTYNGVTASYDSSVGGFDVNYVQGLDMVFSNIVITQNPGGTTETINAPDYILTSADIDFTMERVGTGTDFIYYDVSKGTTLVLTDNGGRAISNYVLITPDGIMTFNDSTQYKNVFIFVQYTLKD